MLQWLFTNWYGQILANWGAFYLLSDAIFHGLCIVSTFTYLILLTFLRYHKNEVDIALDKLKKSEKHKEDSDYETNFKTANRIKAKQVIVQDKVYDVLWTTEIRIAFIAHLVVRVLMELIFIALHYRLQMEQNGVSVNETQPDVS